MRREEKTESTHSNLHRRYVPSPSQWSTVLAIEGDRALDAVVMPKRLLVSPCTG
jgi:hypothetical protein